MLTPGEGAVGIDFDRPVMRSEGAEYRYHASVDSGHGIAWRPGGEVGCGDMDPIGGPLRNTIGIQPLQPWRPTVFALVVPLHVGVTSRNVG